MRSLIALSVTAFALGCLGCGGATSTNVANTNQPVANTNAITANGSPSAADVPSPTEIAAPGSLATPSDAYRTAHAVREKKDVAGLKRIMSKEVIEFLTMIAEGEKKTVDDEIAEMFEKRQAKKPETRNEKINGDRATVEFRLEEGAWKTMDFVKEGSEWKLALPPREVDDGSTTDEKSGEPH